MNKQCYTNTTDVYKSEGVHRHLVKEQIPIEFGDWSRTVESYDGLENMLDSPNLYTDIDTLEDVIFFNNLPDKITVYRGANKVEATEGFGQSWTLDPDIAEFFAYDYYSTWSFKNNSYFANENRCIYQAIIPKDKVLVYTNSRKEYECILNAEYCKLDLNLSQSG